MNRLARSLLLGALCAASASDAFAFTKDALRGVVKRQMPVTAPHCDGRMRLHGIVRFRWRLVVACNPDRRLIPTCVKVAPRLIRGDDA